MDEPVISLRAFINKLESPESVNLMVLMLRDTGEDFRQTVAHDGPASQVMDRYKELDIKSIRINPDQIVVTTSYLEHIC